MPNGDNYLDKIFGALNNAYGESGVFTLSKEEFANKIESDTAYATKIFGALDGAYGVNGSVQKDVFTLSKDDFFKAIYKEQAPKIINTEKKIEAAKKAAAPVQQTVFKLDAAPVSEYEKAQKEYDALVNQYGMTAQQAKGRKPLPIPTQTKGPSIPGIGVPTMTGGTKDLISGVNTSIKQRDQQLSIAEARAEKAKAELDKQAEILISNVTRDEQSLDRFMRANVDGERVPNDLVISSYVKVKLAEVGGEPEGLAHEYLKNKLTAAIGSYDTIKEAQKRTDAAFSKKHGGKTLQDIATEQAKKATADLFSVAKKENEAIVSTIDAARKEDIDQLIAPIRDNMSAANSEIDAYQKNIESQIALTRAAFEGGQMSADDANASIKALQDDYEAKYNAYKQTFEQLNLQSLNLQGEVNSRYNRLYARRRQELEATYTQKAAELEKTFGKLDPKLVAEYKQLFAQNVEDVEKAKAASKNIYLRTKAGIMGSPALWAADLISGLGSGGLKTIATAFDWEWGQKWGDYISRSFTQSEDASIKEIGDLLDPVKFSKSVFGTIGGMVPTVVAGLGTAAATGGFSVPAQLAIQGGVGMAIETAQNAGAVKDEVFRETGSLQKANRAANITVQDNLKKFYLYFAEGVPFISKLSLGIKGAGVLPTLGRAGVKGAIETVFEVPQEFNQGGSEKRAIETIRMNGEEVKLSNYTNIIENKPFKDSSEKRPMTPSERLYETALNVVAPTFFMGGAGEVVTYSFNKISYGAGMISAIKNKMGDISPNFHNQFIYDLYLRRGENYTAGYITSLRRQGLITQEEFTEVANKFDGMKKVADVASRSKLTPGSSKVLMALQLDADSKKAILDAATDETERGLAQVQYDKSKANLDSFIKGKNPDYLVVRLENNEQYVLTYDEAQEMLSDPDFVNKSKGAVRFHVAGSEILPNGQNVYDVLKQKYNVERPTAPGQMTTQMVFAESEVPYVNTMFADLESRMTNAEEIPGSDIDIVLDGLYEQLEIIYNNYFDTPAGQEAAKVISDKIDQLTSYEFRTGEEVKSPAEGSTAQAARRAVEERRGIIDRTSGTSAAGPYKSVTVTTGFRERGAYAITFDEQDRVVLNPTSGAPIIIGFRGQVNKAIQFVSANFGKNGMPTSLTFRIGIPNENGVMPEVTMSTSGMFTQEELLDILIDMRAAEVGEVTQEDFDNAYNSITRPDAIQEQAAGQVPVQPEARPGETVAERAARTGPEKTAQAGQAQVQAQEGAPQVTSQARGETLAGMTPENAVRSIARALQATGIKVFVVETQEEMDRISGLTGTDGLFIGTNGEIYFSLPQITGTFGKTIIFHEATHPVINIIRNTNPELYKKVADGLKQAMKGNAALRAAAQSIIASPNYATQEQRAANPDIFNKIENGLALNSSEIARMMEPGSAIEDEIIVETIARIASGDINPSRLSTSLIDSLKEMINKMAAIFNIPPIAKVSDRTSFINTARAISDALKTGKSIAGIVGEENVGKFKNTISDGQYSIDIRIADKGVQVPRSEKLPLKIVPSKEESVMRRINELLDKYPKALTDKDQWKELMSRVFPINVDGEVFIPAFPEGLARMAKNVQETLKEINKVSDEQRKLASEGLKGTKEIGELYKQGKMDEVDTGLYFLWNIMSIGISPYPQESGFLQAVNGGIDKYIKLAADGKFIKETLEEYLNWVDKVLPKGTPGAGSKSNLNSFGKSFLSKAAEKIESGEFEGKTKLQALHEILSDRKTPTNELRRKWQANMSSMQFNNKIFDFILLTTGRSDLFVTDRVRVDHFWDGNNFKKKRGLKESTSLYDGSDLTYGASTGAGFSKILSDVPGLVFNELANRTMTPVVKKAYKQIGVKEYPEVGRFHWETWVAASSQEVSHGSIDAIVQRKEKGEIQDAGIRQGKYGAWDFNFSYKKRAGKDFVYEFVDNDGNTYVFDKIIDIQDEIENQKKKTYETNNRFLLPDEKGNISRPTKGLSSAWYDTELVDAEKYFKFLRSKAKEIIPAPNVFEDQGVVIETSVDQDKQASAGISRGDRTEPVNIPGSPAGTYINVGLLEGMTEARIPISDITSKLPVGVDVIDAKEVTGTEPTVSIQISRKLSDSEMDQLLLDTKQMAIPQLSEGEGVLHGTTDWGPFNPDFFIMPENRSLADITGVRGTQLSAGIKRGNLVAGTYYEPNLTTDAKGNYVFFHVTDASPKSIMKGIDSRKFQSLRTSREEKGLQYGIASFYTKPEDGERMVGGTKYYVTIAPNKVYPMDTDPNGYRAAAEKKIKEGTPFREEKVRKAIAESATKDGFEMAIGEWAYDRTGRTTPEVPALRGDALTKLMPKEYKGSEDFKTGAQRGITTPYPGQKYYAAKQDLFDIASDIESARNRKNKYDEVYDIANKLKSFGGVIENYGEPNEFVRDINKDEFDTLYSGATPKQKASLDSIEDAYMSGPGYQASAGIVRGDVVMLGGNEVSIDALKVMYNSPIGSRNGAKYGDVLEYNGNNKQIIDVVNYINNKANPYVTEEDEFVSGQVGKLKGGYIESELMKAFNSMPFNKFMILYRKHIDPNLKREGRIIPKGMKWEEVAADAVAGTKMTSRDSDAFIAFAKDAGITIPPFTQGPSPLLQRSAGIPRGAINQITSAASGATALARRLRNGMSDMGLARFAPGVENKALRDMISQDDRRFYTPISWSKIKDKIDTMSEAELIDAMDVSDPQTIWDNIVSMGGPAAPLALQKYMQIQFAKRQSFIAAGNTVDAERIDQDIKEKYISLKEFGTILGQALGMYRVLKSMSSNTDFHVDAIEAFVDSTGGIITKDQRAMLRDNVDAVLAARLQYESELQRINKLPAPTESDMAVLNMAKSISMNASTKLNLYIATLMQDEWASIYGTAVKGGLLSYGSALLSLMANTLVLPNRIAESALNNMTVSINGMIRRLKGGQPVGSGVRAVTSINAKGLIKALENLLQEIKKFASNPFKYVSEKITETRNAIANYKAGINNTGALANAADIVLYGSQEHNDRMFGIHSKMNPATSMMRVLSSSKKPMLDIKGMVTDIEQSYKKSDFKSWLRNNYYGMTYDEFMKLDQADKENIKDQFFADKKKDQPVSRSFFKDLAKATSGSVAELNFRMLALTDYVPKSIMESHLLERVGNNLGLDGVDLELFKHDPYAYVNNHADLLSPEVLNYVFENAAELTMAKETGSGRLSVATVNLIKNLPNLIRTKGFGKKDQNIIVDSISGAISASVDTTMPYVQLPMNATSYILDFAFPLKSAAKSFWFFSLANEAKKKGKDGLADSYSISGYKYMSRSIIGSAYVVLATTIATIPGLVRIGGGKDEDEEERRINKTLGANVLNVSAFRRYINNLAGISNETTEYRDGDTEIDLKNLGVLGMMVYAYGSSYKAARSKFMESKYSNEMLNMDISKNKKLKDYAWAGKEDLDIIDSFKMAGQSIKYMLDQAWFLSIANIADVVNAKDDDGYAVNKLISTYMVTAASAIPLFSAYAKKASDVVREMKGEPGIDTNMSQLDDFKLDFTESLLYNSLSNRNYLMDKIFDVDPLDDKYVSFGMFGKPTSPVRGEKQELPAVIWSLTSPTKDVVANWTDTERFFNQTYRQRDMIDLRGKYSLSLMEPKLNKKETIIVPGEAYNEAGITGTFRVPAKDYNELTMMAGKVNERIINRLADRWMNYYVDGVKITPEDLENPRTANRKEVSDVRKGMAIAISESHKIVNAFLKPWEFMKQDTGDNVKFLGLSTSEKIAKIQAMVDSYVLEFKEYDPATNQAVDSFVPLIDSEIQRELKDLADKSIEMYVRELEKSIKTEKTINEMNKREEVEAEDLMRSINRK